MCCTDELTDISLVQAFNLLMELFISTANEVLTISEQEINDFVEKFLASIPEIFKIKFKTIIWVLKVIFCAFTIDFSRSTAIFDVRSLSYGYYDAPSERI